MHTSSYSGRCYFYNNESRKSEWCLPRAQFESSVRPSEEKPPQPKPTEVAPRQHVAERSSPSRHTVEAERHGRRASPERNADRGVDPMKAASQERAHARGRRSADSSGSDAYYQPSHHRSRTESPLGVAAAFREASKKRSESSHRSSRDHSASRKKQSYAWDENSPPNVSSEAHHWRHREERPPEEHQQHSPSRMAARNDMVEEMPPSRRTGDSFVDPMQRSMDAPFVPAEWRPPMEPPARATYRAEWLPAEAHRPHEMPWRHPYHEGYVAPSAEDIMLARQRNGGGGAPPLGPGGEAPWQLRPRGEPAEFRGRYQSASVERGRSWGRPESSYGMPGHDYQRSGVDYQRPPSMLDECRSSSRQRSQSQPRYNANA